MGSMILATLLACGTTAASTLAPPSTGVCGDRQSTAEALVSQATDAMIERAIASDDWTSAAAETERLFSALTYRARDNQPGLLAESLIPARLANDMRTVSQGEGALKPEQIDVIARFFLDHPALAGRWFALRDANRDDLPSAYRLLDLLIQTFGAGAVRDYFGLCAAVCVVHDRPLERTINENKVQSGDPVELVRYFMDSDRALAISTRDLPPELLVYVVDAAASPNELAWASSRYANDRNIGNRFFEIEYDHDHFRNGTTKRVTASGRYGLPAIKELGGVCADQAYFAETVGKAIGIPTAYVRARSGDSSHAWIGFAEVRGRNAGWNFENGRYPDYQNLRGTLINPQTGATIPDSYLQLLTDAAMSPQRKIVTASALAQAATAIRQASAQPQGAPPELPLELPPEVLLPAPRQPDATTQMALMRLSVDALPTSTSTWLTVSRWAQDGDLSEQELDAWAQALDRVCGRSYPDFTFDTLEGMINSVQDVPRRVQLWEWVFDEMHRSRPDLAAIVRLNEGDAFASVKDYENAWRAFADVFEQFPNDSSLTPEALQKAGELLRAQGRLEEIIPYVNDVLQQLDRPESSAMFRGASNYNRVLQYKFMVCSLTGDRAGAEEARRELER